MPEWRQSDEEDFAPLLRAPAGHRTVITLTPNPSLPQTLGSASPSPPRKAAAPLPERRARGMAPNAKVVFPEWQSSSSPLCLPKLPPAPPCILSAGKNGVKINPAVLNQNLCRMNTKMFREINPEWPRQSRPFHWYILILYKIPPELIAGFAAIQNFTHLFCCTSDFKKLGAFFLSSWKMLWLKNIFAVPCLIFTIIWAL